MTGIIVVPLDPSDGELEEICIDITEYSVFVQTQTGLQGQALFDATIARYSKIGWVPWDQLTWKPVDS